MVCKIIERGKIQRQKILTHVSSLAPTFESYSSFRFCFWDHRKYTITKQPLRNLFSTTDHSPCVFLEIRWAYRFGFCFDVPRYTTLVCRRSLFPLFLSKSNSVTSNKSFCTNMTPSSRKRIVDCASTGEPPMKKRGSIQTVKFVVCDFKNREEKKGEPVFSPALKAHGYEWEIDVYPKGYRRNASFSCFLNVVRAKVTASYCICTRICKETIKQFTFREGNTPPGSHFRELEEDGSLVIECDIQIAVPTKNECI